jgi:thiol-disulfide isomerase/thioredoxin
VLAFCVMQFAMKRSWIGAGLIAAGLLALIAGLLWRQAADGDTRAARLDGATLLALSLPDVQGKDQPIAQWKGKVLVVNFWATWCEPCREEMPRFIKMQEELGANGLQFVGIAIDQPDKVRRFATEIQLNYPALIGGYGAIELSKSFGNQFGALPFTVVMDRAGRIVHTQLGPLKDVQLRSIISQLI